MKTRNTQLEFFTTEEMIKEISKRTTFAGVIIYSDEEHLTDDQLHSNFKIFSSTDMETTKKLLARICQDAGCN